MDRLEAELKAAAGHPLEPRYRGYMESLPELAAERAWRAIEPYTRQEKFTLPSAAAAIRLLRAFEQQHGETEFARSVRSKATQLRAKAEPALEIIIDNDSPKVTVVGKWASSKLQDNRIGKDYLHDENRDKGNKSVSYVLPIEEPGDYEVFAWYVNFKIYASDVPIDIIHAGGTRTVSINQRKGGGVWTSLGTYPFTQGKPARVTIRTDKTNGHVIADAFRFVLRP